MAEPVTTSAGAAAAGLFGLLVTIFGPLVGGVAAVTFASVAGVEALAGIRVLGAQL